MFHPIKTVNKAPSLVCFAVHQMQLPQQYVKCQNIACSDRTVLIRSDNLHKDQIFKEKTVFGGYAEKVAIMLFVTICF